MGVGMSYDFCGHVIKFSCIIWQMLSHMFIKAYGF